jgi:hypothetical protein
MALRSTQSLNYRGGGFYIRGSQAHSNRNARKYGTKERATPTLPKLKFLEEEEIEDKELRMVVPVLQKD